MSVGFAELLIGLAVAMTVVTVIRWLRRRSSAPGQTEKPGETAGAGAAQKDGDDKAIYRVVKNDGDQFSIWAADRELPLGWSDVGHTGTKQECLDHAGRLYSETLPKPTVVDDSLDQEALAQIAISDTDWRASERAAKKLTDQALIATVAKTARDEVARISAVYNLEDPRALAEIAKSDPDSGVRKAAARMLTQRAPVDDAEVERIRSAAGRTDGLLFRCGGCGNEERAKLEVVLDTANNRGVLCDRCVTEYFSLLRTGSSRRFWQCRTCNYRILAGTRADVAVDAESRCPKCGADVKVSLVNLGEDRPVSSGSFGEPLT